MPGVTEYLPPTSPERGDYYALVQDERQKRRTVYDKAVLYYKGKHNPVLSVEAGEIDDNTESNYVKMAADRTASFLFPDIPSVTLNPDSIEQTEDEVWLQNFFKHNKGLAFLNKLALQGFLAGHTFVKMTPAQPYPRLTLLEPTSVMVYWRNDDVGDVLWYEQQFLSGNILHLRDYINMGDFWLIRTYKQLGGSHNTLGITSDKQLRLMFNETFGLNAWELVESRVHPYSVPPIFETAHLPDPENGYYGLSEFDRSVYRLQDAINRVTTQIARITRLNSDPVDVIIGADPDEVDVSGDLITVPSSAAKVTRLEMNNNLTSLVGVLDRNVETILSLMRVVLLRGGAKDLQRVTNTSVRTLYIDMLAKNSVLRSAYGHTIKNIVELALVMGNKPKPVNIAVGFDNPLPVDMTELANVAAIMVSMQAMSRRSASESIGLVWEAEKAHIETERNWVGEDAKPDSGAAAKLEGVNSEHRFEE